MPTNLIYQPTFLQKLLGANYKWWYLFACHVKSSTVYRWGTIINVSAMLLEVGAILIVWYITLASGSQLTNFSYILSYYVVGNIFKILSQNNFQGDLNKEIFNGKLANKLLLPGNVWTHYFCQGIGADFFGILVKTFFISLLAIFNWNIFIFPSSLFDSVIFVLMFLVISVMQIFLSIIFGSLAFFITDAFGVLNFTRQLESFTSGKLFPLNLFYPTLWLTMFPFAFTFYHPMQIYLGKYTTNEIIYVFLGGIAWCLVLYFLAKLVFKLGLKRNESVGL